MADLSILEKNVLEDYFDMGGGYVLDFYTNSYSEFCQEIGIDIFNSVYTSVYGGSKAKATRGFWKVATPQLVAKWIRKIIEYRNSKNIVRDAVKEGKVLEIAQKLENLAAETIDHTQNLEPNFADKDFALLTEEIKKSCSERKYQVALDRLHTFCVKYVRHLLSIYNVTDWDKETSLNALIGKYIKSLENKDLIESPMSLTIIKNSISVFEKFNAVRNEKSFAHDSKLLNQLESEFVVQSVSLTISFIRSLEIEMKNKASTISTDSNDDLPF